MRWLLKRIGQVLITIFVVITLSFVLVRLMPGNVIDALIAELETEGVEASQIQTQVTNLAGINPEDPIHIAYIDYMTDVLRGDLGTSLWSGKEVSVMIADALPWTVFLLSWATFLSFFVGIALGALMAYYEGGRLDLGLTSYAMVAGSIPYYVFAILLVLFLSYRYQIFPTSGRAPNGMAPGFTWPYISGVINHAILPVLSLVLSGGIASLSMRGNSIRVLGEDYLRVARLRGLSDRTIAVQYVARNALLPMYTGFMISLGSMFSGAVILETVFSYYGMGFILVQSVDHRDYPVMLGCFMVITIAVVVALFVADLTYSKIDPRVEGTNSDTY